MSLVLLAACSEVNLATPASETDVIAPQSASSTPAQTAKAPIATTIAAPSAALTVKAPVATSPAQTAKAPLATTPAQTAKASTPTPSTQVGPKLEDDFRAFPYADSEFFAYIPAKSRQPGKVLQIMFAIHGMGNKGRQFGQPLLEYAEEYNLTLVAPTMKYAADYNDPAQIMANDMVLLPQLYQLLSALPADLGHPINSKILLFGFSRGGQIVHRFATFYPERVRGVAVISAGNYTLPSAQYHPTTTLAPANVNLRFPYGVSDVSKYIGHDVDLDALRQVVFWIGVGGADIATKDVPPAWTPYLGKTRVERATSYFNALKEVGVSATLTIFPGVEHTVCKEMKQSAFGFFNSLVN